MERRTELIVVKYHQQSFRTATREEKEKDFSSIMICRKIRLNLRWSIVFLFISFSLLIGKGFSFNGISWSMCEKLWHTQKEENVDRLRASLLIFSCCVSQWFETIFFSSFLYWKGNETTWTCHDTYIRHRIRSKTKEHKQNQWHRWISINWRISSFFFSSSSSSSFIQSIFSFSDVFAIRSMCVWRIFDSLSSPITHASPFFSLISSRLSISMLRHSFQSETFFRVDERVKHRSNVNEFADFLFRHVANLFDFLLDLFIFDLR